MTLDTFGIWLAAGLTLAIYTFLYKENPIYRVAEHLYVGLGAGHGIVVYIDGYIRPTLKVSLGQKHMWSLLIPLVLGLMMYTRYFKSIAYLSRWTMAFFFGVGAGYVLTKDFKPYFITQITGTFKPFFVAGKPFSTTINNTLLVLGVVCTLMYFFFTTKRVGVLHYGSVFGRWVMMVAFGAAFGNTVMARVSLFLGRMQFMLIDWLKVLK
jgi:hypothetical protein